MNGLGYALLLKVDGSQPTFNYNSGYWTTQRSSYNTGAVTGGLDNTEYQSSLYSVYPFSSLLLGMRVPDASTQINWLTMTYGASSLWSVIHAGGLVVSNAPTREQFEALAGPQASLQLNCPEVGFSLRSFTATPTSVRIGMLTNDQNDCSSPDSFLGFGGLFTYTIVNLPAGNFCAGGASCDSGGGSVNIPAFGYVLAR